MAKSLALFCVVHHEALAKKVRCLNWDKLQGFLCTPFVKYYLADRYFFHRPLIKVTTEWVAQTTTDIVTRKYRFLSTAPQRNNVYLDNRDFQRCLLIGKIRPFIKRRTLSNTHLSSSIRNKSSFYTSNRGTQREYSSNPLKHSIVERILVFKR